MENQEIELRHAVDASVDDEIVVHRDEEEEAANEGGRRVPKKPKTLFGLPPIVTMKPY